MEKRIIRMHRNDSDFYKPIKDIMQDITAMGYTVELDPEGNPVTCWLYTDCPVETLRHVNGVFDCI